MTIGHYDVTPRAKDCWSTVLKIASNHREQIGEEPNSTVLNIKCSIYFVALVIRYAIFLFTRRLTSGKERGRMTFQTRQVVSFLTA